MDGFNWCTIIDVRAPSNLGGGDFLARKNYAMPESVRISVARKLPSDSRVLSFPVLLWTIYLFSSHLYTTYDYIYFNTLLNLVLQSFLHDSTSPKAFIIIVLIMKGCLSLCLHSWWAPGKFKRYKKKLSAKNVPFWKECVVDSSDQTEKHLSVFVTREIGPFSGEMWNG